jgi:hypothetical protein
MNMLVRWLLFETWIGEFLLRFLERYVGLAVVQADWLALQRSGEPKTVSEVQ